MKFEDHLRTCLLSFPSIYPTALRVYDHLFIVIGNGYEWIDGELVSDSDYCFNVEDAIVKNINFTLVENNAFLKRMMSVSDNVLEKTVERMIEDSIKPLFHVEERMKDFTIPEWFNERGKHNDDNRFMFYDLSKYSKLYTIPDNVKNDWLIAAKKMVDILEKNPDRFEDREGIFEEVKERVNKLYNERYNKIIYLGEEYECIGMTTEESGAGCHSWESEVYVCRKIDDGYTRTFDYIEDMRLINQDDYKK